MVNNTNIFCYKTKPRSLIKALMFSEAGKFNLILRNEEIKTASNNLKQSQIA